ncbi:MAG: hypothetical protein KBS63_01470 [Clostridiales bacterium]|nr:hypothetical protein [Candidatus Crickella caballi]
MEQSEESCKKESKAARKALKKAKKKSKEKTKGLAADSGITEEQMARNEERLHTTLDVAGMIDPTGVMN